MGEILSTIKPELQKKPEPKIEYNDRSYESYIKTGFPEQIPHNVSAPRDRILAFLHECDIRKGPIERTVTSMFRLKAIDWTSPKRERKEFIWYEERWTGVNWLGIPIKNPVDGHIEGRHIEVLTRPVLDERTGEHIDNAFAGTRVSYYITWNKKNVDEIIANSAHSDKSGIRFTILFGMEDGPDGITMTTRNYFSYDQFANWSWEKLRDFQYWPADDLENRARAFKKSANNLEFKPG